MHLFDIKKSHPDTYRAVIIALVIAYYPTHRIWRKLEEICPDELAELQYAVQSAIGVLAGHGGEDGIRLRQFLDSSPHYEYTARKWVGYLNPISDVGISADILAPAEKKDIDFILHHSMKTPGYQTSRDIIGRNLYILSRTLLQYVSGIRDPLSCLAI
jgi:hypothetical protein